MTWVLKANLRGPAGYNATGSAEDDAAIAAFIDSIGTPTDTRAALELAVAEQTARVVNLGLLPGAAGDGITDNTAIFQAALDAVAATGDEITTFYLPPGVWLTDGLRFKSNCRLIGAGGGTYGLNSFDGFRTTMLKLIANSTVNALLSDYGTGTSLAYGLVFQDLLLDGNKSNQVNAVMGIEAQDSASGQDPLWRLERVYVRNFKGNGIRFGSNRRACRVMSCEVDQNDGHGIVLGASDCTVANSLIGRNGGDGIYINQTLQHISECDLFGNLNGINIDSTNAVGIMIQNCGIDRNLRNGILNLAPRLLVIGCNFNSNGLSADNTYSAINLGAAAVACSVVGCSVEWVPSISANKIKYIIDTTVNVLVTGMSFLVSSAPFATAAYATSALAVMMIRSQAIAADGIDILFGSTTGTRLGTSATQKIGFWNATPVVQPAANPNTSGASLAQVETEVNELKALLRSVGLMAT